VYGVVGWKLFGVHEDAGYQEKAIYALEGEERAGESGCGGKGVDEIATFSWSIRFCAVNCT
jgi:hypothetical protein